MRSGMGESTWSSRASHHLLMCVFVVGGCLRGSLAHAADDVLTLLDKAQQCESLVKTGRVKLEMVREITPPTEKEARERYGATFAKNPKLEQAMMEWIRHGIDRVAWSEDLVFDNTRKAAIQLEVDHRDPSALIASDRTIKSNMDKTVEISKTVQSDKVTHIKGDPHYEVRVYKASWPPYEILLSCMWLKQVADAKATPADLKVIENNTTTGQAILMNSSGPQSAYNQKIWIDTKSGYAMPRLEGYDKKTGRLVQEKTCSYKLYQGKYWYPVHLVETYYQYKEDGTRYVMTRYTIDVQTVDLNCDIPKQELEVGDIPFGATVHDERFEPALNYRQGDKQFTDEELFKARDDKRKLQEMQSVPSKPATRPMSSSIPIIIGGLSIFTISIVMARKSRR